MKKILIITLFAFLFTITGCTEKTVSGENTQNENLVLESNYITIDGIYVDESYEDEDMGLVYLFYTINANDSNIELSSTSMSMRINDKNDYTSNTNYDLIPKYTNYYYSSFIKDIYVDQTYKVCSTIEVAKGDLEGSKTITLSNSNISDIDKIKFTTDNIKHMDNIADISKDLDSEVFEVKYTKEQNALADVDEDREKYIHNNINGYYYTINVNIGTQISQIELEFSEPNNFTLTSNFGLSNYGTYEVKNSIIILNYHTGLSKNVSYELDENGDVILTNASEEFSSYVDYDPLEED